MRKFFPYKRWNINAEVNILDKNLAILKLPTINLFNFANDINIALDVHSHGITL